jgi:propionyl-CoA carboxylase beta chain
MKELILKVGTRATFEISKPCQEHRHWLRPHRRPYGRLRRQPADGAGGRVRLDASRKAARFVRFCDAFNIPIVTFVDAGLPAAPCRKWRLIKHGALLFAIHSALAPLVTVITRRPMAAFDAMASKEIGADMNYAPTAQIAVMAPRARSKSFRSDIGDADKIAARTKNTDRFLSPFIAERGYVDDVIMPHSRGTARGRWRCQGQEGRCRRRSTTICRDCLIYRRPARRWVRAITDHLRFCVSELRFA